MAGVMSGWPRTATTRVVWEVRRLVRRVTHRLGLPWLLAFLGAASLLSALWLRESQHDRWERASRSVTPWLTLPQGRPATVEPDARARLRAFDDHLPEHDAIPVALQDLIALAEANGLTLARGNYRPQLEAQGGYLRYRMTLPVIGQADAVQRFMMAALRDQHTLSLESVQFKRERSDTSVVEARIQWALLTRMPQSGPLRTAGGGGTK
jgi:hypothetical protein